MGVLSGGAAKTSGKATRGMGRRKLRLLALPPSYSSSTQKTASYAGYFTQGRPILRLSIKLFLTSNGEPFPGLMSLK